MSDQGIKLALTLACDTLKDVERVVEQAHATLDHDEKAAGFVVDHHAMCPAFDSELNRCACGLRMLMLDLRDAGRLLEQQRQAFTRILKEMP